MVMAQSLFRLLKKQQPQQPIDVLAAEWSLPLISRMPEVRKGIALPFMHGELALAKRRQLGQRLRAENYRQAIILPRSMKAALVPWFAGIRRRTGFRGEVRFGLINDMRPLDKSLLDQTVKRFLALGLPLDEPLPAPPEPRLSVSAERQQILLSKLGLDTAKPVIAILPGAEYGPAKCWPLEYFAELAGQLHASGYAIWILGSANDVAAGERIAARVPVQNLCGRTELADAIDLLAMCHQAVSNDSGLLHVAAAVGLRVNAIYGSSTPAYTPPLSRLSRVHYLGIECSPCFQRKCPLGHLRCLREITPQQVLSGMQVPTSGKNSETPDKMSKQY